MPRKTKAERRIDYLAIGGELIDEAPNRPMRHGGYALAHVRLSEVAARAGVTKGALYHIWSSQEDFWRDLLDHFLEQNRSLRDDMLTAIEHSIAPLRGLDRLHSYADALFASATRRPLFLTELSLVPYVEDAAMIPHLEADLHALVLRSNLIVSSVLEHLGRVPRPGITLDQISLALGAALHGAVMHDRALPDTLPKDIRTDSDQTDGPARSLLGCTFEALLLGLTHPAPEADR